MLFLIIIHFCAAKVQQKNDICKHMPFFFAFFRFLYTVHCTPYTFTSAGGWFIDHLDHLTPISTPFQCNRYIGPKDYPIIPQGLPKDKTRFNAIMCFYYIYTMYIYTSCCFLYVNEILYDGASCLVFAPLLTKNCK